MPIDVSAVLSVITDMLPGVVFVGVAVLSLRASIEAFKWVRAAIGGGSTAVVVDPYDNARVRSIHEENAWDPEWDK